MEDFIAKIQKGTHIKTKAEVRMMAPLTLAYMGDVIFEMFIRNYLVNLGKWPVGDLHKKAISYVKAKSQAKIVHELADELTEEEWGIVKKGRNQKSASAPKNTELIDYKYATGFEALLGYYYYIGDNKRLMEIMQRSVEIIDKEL